MSNLAVILARAGSKGLPDKCMRRVLGRSLIDYSLTHALTSTRLDAVVLSTDSAPAKQSAESRSVEVIDRPPQLADDMATIDAAARHAVEKWEHRHDQRVSNVVILYANIPVRAEGVIDRALERLISTGATSVRTVAPVGKHHPDWLFRLEGDRMVQLRPNGIHRRQDLEPVYYHDGAVIAVTREALFSAAGSGDSQAFLGADRRALVQRCEDAVDVDEPMDLLLAEAVLRDHRSSSGRAAATEHVAAAELPFVVKGSRPTGSTFVVAEIGVNHDGQVGKAIQLVDSAIDAGADAVKLQVFYASELASSAAPLAEYQKAAGDDNQREMLRRLELSEGELQQIARYCRERGIALLATPFSPRDVERVVRLGVVAIKIASTDLTNTPLLRTAAQTTLPLVVSTGAATREEILATSARLRAWRVADRLVLLHCVSRYPAPLSSINLRAIASLSETLGVPVGFSDHTTNLAIGAWAVAAGAVMLEKHLTLNRSDSGPDHAMSLDPAEFAAYVAAVRQVDLAVGSGDIGMADCELDVRRVARKSIVVRQPLPAGTVLSAEMLAVKRPGGGIEPDCLDALVGRTLAVDVPGDSLLAWEQLR